MRILTIEEAKTFLRTAALIVFEYNDQIDYIWEKNGGIVASGHVTPAEQVIQVNENGFLPRNRHLRNQFTGMMACALSQCFRTKEYHRLPEEAN